jgi:Carboxypeptidase regulatory-like domain/TonB-dependent Receptor Plug Domain
LTAVSADGLLPARVILYCNRPKPVAGLVVTSAVIGGGVRRFSARRASGLLFTMEDGSMKRTGLLLVLFLIAGLLAAPVSAQEQTGSIEGMVKDSSGAVLPGVTVEARSPGVVGVSTAVTDARGVFRFPALPPGLYEITATLQGFNPAKLQNVGISLGQLMKVDLTLSVGGVQESVQVTGEAPLIDTKQNAQFATVQRETIQKLPKGRDFTSVVAVAPGAQAEAYSGGTQIDGASGSENKFIVDGMDTTALRSGTSGKTVLMDFIQEVQVKSAGYNAEYGGSTGGVISAITNSGSNVYHGGATLYYEGSRLRNGNPDLPRINPYDDVNVEAVNVPVDPRSLLSPVLDIGGPLFKDKLWFYVGYSNTNDHSERTVKFLQSPTFESRTYTDITKANYLNWNLNTALSSNFRIKFSGANNWQSQRGTLPVVLRDGTTLHGQGAALEGLPGNGYSTSTFSSDAQSMKDLYENTGSDYINNVFSGNVDWVITPTFFANLTAGSFRYNTTTPPDFIGKDTQHYFSSSNMSYLPGVIPSNLRQPSAYTDTKLATGTVKAQYGRFFLNANSTWYKSAGGQHTFKAGMRYERLSQDSNDGYQKPRIMLYWNLSTTDLNGKSARGTYGYYKVRQITTFGAVHSNNYSFWLQDSWSINRNLTVNAGVRVENEHVPTYTQSSDAKGIDFGFLDKLAPRIGFAYDVKGDSRWKVYGSYGHFFDMTKLSLPMGSFGADKWIDYYFTLDTFNWPTINCTDGMAGTGCTGGTLIKSRDMRYNSSANDPRLVQYGISGVPRSAIDPTLKPYQTRELTFGLDHELNPTTSVGVRYVHKWMIKAIEDVGRLLPFGELYFISNPGYGDSYTILPDFPDKHTPPATRKYDSAEVRLKRRMKDHWQAELSYTYSRLWGNYSGLGASDEEGRTDPNNNRSFDSLYQSFDDTGNWVFGLLKTDRPHVFKAQGFYDLPWGTTVGLFGIVQSGIPWSSYLSWEGYSPVFFAGRGNMGRTPLQTRVNLSLSHEFRIKRSRVSVTANVDNLLNASTVTDYWENVWRDDVAGFGDAKFFAGFDPYKLVAQMKADDPSSIRDNPLYGKAYNKMGARSIRLSARFSF